MSEIPLPFGWNAKDTVDISRIPLLSDPGGRRIKADWEDLVPVGEKAQLPPPAEIKGYFDKFHPGENTGV